MVRVTGSAGITRPQLGQAAVEAGPLLFVAAGAWAGTVLLARGMAGMSGTMGLGLASFVPVWTLMMAAMMLPSVASAALRYAWSGPAAGQPGPPALRPATSRSGPRRACPRSGWPGWPAG